MTRSAVPSLVVATMLLATVCWEATNLLQQSITAISGRTAPAVIAAAPPPPTEADPVDAWAATALARPLLRESRRPDKVADPQRKGGDEVLRLVGVVTGPFGDHAIFTLPGIPKPVVATVGTQVSDFVVRSIEPGRVLVDAAGRSRTYRTAFGGKNFSIATDPKRL